MTDSTTPPLAEVFAEYNFAIIDPIQMADAIGRGECDRLLMTPLVPEGFEEDGPKLPLLVDLDVQDEAARSHWLQALEKARESNQPPPFGALLKGPPGAQERAAMHQHLAKQLIQRNLESNQRFLLRYYDPRVFVHLQWIFKPHQLARIFGPALQWGFIYQGLWHHVTVPPPDPHHPLELLIINALQWKQIDRIAQINTVLQQINEQDKDRIRGPFVNESQQVFDLLCRAEQAHRLRDPQDQCAFAVHGMTVSPAFDWHPIMKEIFARIEGDADAVYRYETSMLTPEQWLRIKKDQTPKKLW